ncbi:MAG: AMP-binding protein [Sagittula sp.]|uniref:AMP-binding protein n=1 Tax=Sagittula sp. TaxID=2038081 RepID=UPI004057ED1A
MTTPVPENDPSLTLSDLLDRAGRSGEDINGVRVDDDFLSWSDLSEQTARIASGLMERGVRTDDVVALWSPNSIAYVATYLACARIGAPVMLVNPRLSAPEIGDILRRSNAVALAYDPVCDNGEFATIFARIEAPDLSGLRLVIDLSESGRAGDGPVPAVRLTDLRRCEPLASSPAVSTSGIHIFSTSGSTGPSKLVYHTHGSVSAHAQACAEDQGCHAPGTAFLIPVALTGAYGMTQLCMAMTASRPLIIERRFDPATTAARIRQFEVTHVHAVDEVFIKLLEVYPDEVPFPTLRVCGYGTFSPDGAAFAAESARRSLPIIGLYGTSEIQAFFCTQDPSAPLADRTRPGGHPVGPGAGFRIRELEGSALIEDGSSGEIEVTGPSLMSHYLGNRNATDEALLEDGYYRTGDVGHREPDGTLVLEYRISEVMRLSGFMVAVSEIEKVVEELPAVVQCRAVSVQVGHSMRPAVFVRVNGQDTFDPDAALTHCREKLAKYKVPIAFHVIDEFPLGNSLNAPKIDRIRLREMAQASVDADSAGKSGI